MSPDPRTDPNRCPQHPDHRPLFVESKAYCPDQAHDGRPTSHPQGYAPRTPAFGPWAP